MRAVCNALLAALLLVTVRATSQSLKSALRRTSRRDVLLQPTVAAAKPVLAELPKGLTKDKVEYMRAVNSTVDPFDSPLPKGGEIKRRADYIVPITQIDASVTWKRKRQNFLHMTRNEQEEWLTAIQMLKTEYHPPPHGHNMSIDDTGTMWNTWDYMAYKHLVISLRYKTIANGAMFLPWHRAWLIYYEKQLQRVSKNPNMSMPYWDWSNRDEAWKIFTDRGVGGNGTGDKHYVTNGAFKNWTQKVCVSGGLCKGHLTREYGISHTTAGGFGGIKLSSFGTNTTIRTHGALTNSSQVLSHTAPVDGQLSPEQKEAGTLPSYCDVLHTLGTSRFYSSTDICKPSFLMGLWWMHRSVHVEIGGDMNLVSSNDPLVLLHHTFVDKVWTMWQKSHKNDTINNTYGFPDGDLTTHLHWLNGTVDEYLDWDKMDYDYEWDDNLDERFYRYEVKGFRNIDMCAGYVRQQSGGGYGRNMSYCHLSP